MAWRTSGKVSTEAETGYQYESKSGTAKMFDGFE